MPDLCYPCSVHNHSCVQKEDYVLPTVHSSAQTWHEQVLHVLGEPLPGYRWFDVAFWLNPTRDLFPAYEGCMQAPGAFLAVEAMMRYYKLWYLAYASVRAFDGSIVYHAYHIWVDLREEEMTDE